MARSRIKSGIDNRQVAVYARKSKATETGKSIEIQKEKCIALACAQFDVKEAEILVYVDDGKSGFYADRPQYKRLLRDIEYNKIKAVICYKIDRISRRTVDLLNIVQQMERKGIAFVSVSDKELDTSSRTGKIMISLLSAIAEFERDIIAERIADNMYELAKDGRWLGGECPLGYRAEKEKSAANGKKIIFSQLEPIPEEQKSVNRLFELFLQTSSFTGTAEALNNEDLKTKKGKKFTLTAVKNILRNPVYAIADNETINYFTELGAPIWADKKDFDGIHGIMAYNKTEQVKEIDAESRASDPQYIKRNTRRDIKDWIIAVGRHKGIISGLEWVRAQKIIAEISQNNSARPKVASKALLSGLCRCSICGGRMYVRTESGRFNPDGTLRYRYICDTKYRKKGGCESSPNLNGYEIDNFVMRQLCVISTSMDNICGKPGFFTAQSEKEFYNQFMKAKSILLSKSQAVEDGVDDLKKRLQQIEHDIKNQIINLRAAPENIKQIIYADIETLNTERNEKQYKIEKLYEDIKLKKSQLPEVYNLKKSITNFSNLMSLIDYESKLIILRRIIDRVELVGDMVHIYIKTELD